MCVPAMYNASLQCTKMDNGELPSNIFSFHRGKQLHLQKKCYYNIMLPFIPTNVR